MDPLGALAVSDPDGNRIWRVDPQGKAVVWAGTGTEGDRDGPAAFAQFRTPRGVVFDAAGDLYVADSGNNAIRKVTFDGQVSTLSINGSFGAPEGLAFDQSGNLLVTEPTRLQVVRIVDGTATPLVNGTGQTLVPNPGPVGADFGGAPVVLDPIAQTLAKVVVTPTESSSPPFSVVAGDPAAFFRDGPGPAARFRGPTGLAVNGEYDIFVADTENHRIRKVDRYGKVTTVAGTGTPGNSNGGFLAPSVSFNRPTALTLDPDGALLVVDQGNRLLRKVAPNGEASTPWPRLVVPDGVVAVAVDLLGNVYLLSVEVTGTLTRVSPSGVASTVARDLASPGGMTVDRAGNVYVSEAGTHSLLRFDRRGVKTVLVHSEADLPSPGALVWSPDGRLWVADGQRRQFLAVTAEGLVAGPVVEALAHVAGLSADGYGSLVWTSDNRVLSCYTGDVAGLESLSRGVLASAERPAPFNYPTAVVADPRGGFFVVDGNKIFHMDDQGLATLIAGTKEAGDTVGGASVTRFRQPQGLAVTPDGALLVADTGNNKVKRLDPNGDVTVVLDGLYRPEGLAVAPDGTLYVAENGARQVSVFGPTGRRQMTIGSGASEPSDGTKERAGFSGPHGLALDEAGFVLVADDSGVRLVDAAGNVGTLVASQRWPSRRSAWAKERIWGPMAVATLPGGRWALVDGWGNSVFLGDASGWVHRYAGDVWPGKRDGLAGRLNHPVGLAVGPGESLWVADALNQGLRPVLATDASVPEGWVLEEDTPLLAGPVPVRWTMPMTPDLSSWAGIQPFAVTSPVRMNPQFTASAATSVYLAQDEKYLYWMVLLADGAPRARDGINFNLTLHRGQSRSSDTKLVNLTVGSWDRPPRPQIDWGKDKDWTVPWRGTQFDTVWADGMVQGRFPLSEVRNLLKDGDPLEADFHVWNDAVGGTPAFHTDFPAMPFGF